MHSSIKQSKKQLPKGFVFILAMLTSISPLAIDVYLPSFTSMSSYFDTSIDKIEVTLSIYLVGFGLGQLIGGPLSDRYGRKVFIFTGLCVYILFSFLISFASSVEQLWVYRFFQALGGGFAVVNTNAIVRDLYSGKEAAKVFSIISMIMLVAPMIAPVIGTSILHVLSWDYIFIFLSLYAMVLSYFISKLPETSSKTSCDKNKKSRSLFLNYKIILSNKNSLFLMLAGSFGISSLFIFITKSSFIYMEYFAMQPLYFAFVFSFNALGIMIVTKLNINLLEKYSTFSLLKLGIFFQVFISFLMLLFSNYHNIYTVAVGFVLIISSLGLVFGNIMSLLLENYKSLSASAVALNGVFGFLVAGVMGFLTSYFHDGTLNIVFVMLFIVSLLSFIILSFLVKNKN